MLTTVMPPRLRPGSSWLVTVEPHFYLLLLAAGRDVLALPAVIVEAVALYLLIWWMLAG